MAPLGSSHAAARYPPPRAARLCVISIAMIDHTHIVILGGDLVSQTLPMGARELQRAQDYQHRVEELRSMAHG